MQYQKTKTNLIHKVMAAMKKEHKDFLTKTAGTVLAVVIGLYAFKGLNAGLAKIKMPKVVASPPPPAEKE